MTANVGPRQVPGSAPPVGSNWTSTQLLPSPESQRPLLCKMLLDSTALDTLTSEHLSGALTQTPTTGGRSYT